MRSLITLFVIAAFAATPLVRAADPTPAPSPAASATPAKKHHSKKSKAAPADANATPAAANSGSAPASAATPAAAPATAKKHTAPQPLAQQAAGGGNGMVWVNSESHVYHKEGSKWYGRTKQGKYLSEADAIKEGDHAAKNEK